MTCYFPIPARRINGGPWHLHPQLGVADATIPCGKCLGCRTDNQLDWTIRATHEARLHQNNIFLNLTYDDEHLPRELCPHHLTNFWKRLREHIRNNPSSPIQTIRTTSIRYIASGEYGEKTQRPHYHACVFNLDFEDRRQWNKDLDESETLSTLWGHGGAKCAPFTPARAGYVAGYITKTGKQTYADADGVERHPPFRRASTKPAIGRSWLDQHSQDIQNGYIIHETIKHRIPRYYLKHLQKNAHKNRKLEKTLQTLQDIQQTLHREVTDKHTQQRLQAQAVIHTQRANQKRRTLE